jgi:hypothetical protein
MLTVLEVGMRFSLNLVYFSTKLCQNILSDLGIRGGFTQFILRSPLNLNWRNLCLNPKF